ncbi:MAG: transcriptional regulator [Salinisphaeraceae bacterium]|nr:transcriptional regulator [Salinisphaeraceae bacterium]
MIRILFKQMLDEKSFQERRRITLNEVCEATGLSRPTISRIANTPGYKTNTDSLDVLCRYFGCQPGDLLVWVDEETDGQNQDSV